MHVPDRPNSLETMEVKNKVAKDSLYWTLEGNYIMLYLNIVASTLHTKGIPQTIA